MYTVNIHLYISMALQIANPEVVRKVELLSKLTGLSKTGAVEKAVESLLAQANTPVGNAKIIRRILAQIDQIPDRADAYDPVEFDEMGLPK